MATLTLALKAQYFDEIKAGTKKFEYRKITEYWKKRLVERKYDTIVFTKGYPKRDDLSRRIEFPYRGYEVHTITHEFFGNVPALVFAIRIVG